MRNQDGIMEYVKWRGDLTFQERPLNEVDNLIFSELAYFCFKEILSAEGEAVTIREAYERYLKLENPTTYWKNNNPIPILEECAQSERFGEILVTNHIDIVDPERQVQFAACIFHVGDGIRYIAFRGTDRSIVGWREDFNFSYMEETPAQAEAVKYLDRALSDSPGMVYVGGHSKGGNLAVYASAFCRHGSGRIREVYSNDGPGFNQYIISDPDYQSILPKVRLIIPEASIVSILFSNKSEKEIVQSSAVDGARQHNPYTWVVQRDRFVRAERQNSASILLDETVNKWLEEMTIEEKKAFVTSIFDSLDGSGAVTLDELSVNKWVSYNAILKAAAALSAETRHGFRESLIKLAAASHEVFWDETRKKFEPFRHRSE